jgi:magnesium chelatase family protein
MNPCPCGYLGDANGSCHCSPEHVRRYRNRISGPLLDRLDLHVNVPRVEFNNLRGPSVRCEASKEVASRVMRTREVQMRRQGGCNAVLDNAAVERHCAPSGACLGLLERATSQLGLSARGFHRVLKVARTIADMSGQKAIDQAHIAEALALRSLDRQRG